MSIYDTFANDCRVIDGTETVTLTARRSTGNTSVSILYADAHEVSASEVSTSGGFFQTGDLRFTLWVSQLGGYDPRPGDAITRFDGTVWEILDTSFDDLGLSYECATRKAVGSNDPSPTQPPTGGTVSSGADQFTAVNASGSTFSVGAVVSAGASGLILADATTNTKHAVGLATSGASNGANETVTAAGGFTLGDWTAVTGASNLTAGSLYFLSTTAGRLTTTRPTSSGQVVQQVGRAVSTTTLILDIQEAILIA